MKTCSFMLGAKNGAQTAYYKHTWWRWKRFVKLETTCGRNTGKRTWNETHTDQNLCGNIQSGETQSLWWKGSLFCVTSAAEACVADCVRWPDFTFASLQETTEFLVSAPLPAPFKPFVILDTGLFFPFTLIFQFLPRNIFYTTFNPYLSPCCILLVTTQIYAALLNQWLKSLQQFYLKEFKWLT